MNINNDFKGLWNKQETYVIPNTNEILKRASQLKWKTRIIMLVQNILLIGTIAFFVFFEFYFQPKMMTTKIGVILMIIAMLSFVVPIICVMRDVFKTNMENSTTEFLNQFIRLKQRQEFIQKTLLTLYFVLLSTGIILAMIEYVIMMSVTWRFIAFGLTIGWLTFNWFYLRPRTIKKQQAKLNTIISQLESINEQLTQTK